MRRFLFTLPLCLAAVFPAAAEEIALKDGTRIVGHMTALLGDKIEVETAYGKMQLNRGDIVRISFPENSINDTAPATSATAATAATTAKKDVPAIDDALQGTQYVNRTAKFSLTVPANWKTNPSIMHSTAGAVTGLSSTDNMRYLVVTREEYNGSLESYKGIIELPMRRLGNYEQVFEAAATVDGKAALMASYRGTLPGGQNLPVQFLTLIIPSGTTYTRIAAWCIQPLFKETEATFESIMKSYRTSTLPTTSAQAQK